MAPWNTGFSDLPAETVEKLLEPEWIMHLQDVIKYHVHLGEIPLDSITVTSQSIRMANGQDVQIMVTDGRIKVNGIKAIAYAEPSNGISYMLDAVLLPAFLTQSLVDVAASASATTSTLASLVVAAGYEDVLSDPNADLTVFAPTNDAFAALDPTLLAFLQTAEGAETLETVLLYHVVPGVYPSINIPEGGENLIASLAPPNGQVLTVVRDDMTVFVNDVVVTIPDVLANNGIIHVIPQVLIPPVLPPTGGGTPTAPAPPAPVIPMPTGMAPTGPLPTTMPVPVTIPTMPAPTPTVPGPVPAPAAPVPAAGTLVDIAINTPSLSTLVDAVVAADLQDTLSGAGPFTVFAPDNDAFAAFPAMTDYLNDAGWILHLQETLLFHAASGQVLSSDLTDGMTITMVNGEDVTVDISGVVALTPANMGQSIVETPDVMASNGVAHIVSNVLLPSYFSTTIVDVAKTATPTLAALVVAADLESFLAETVGLTVFAPTDAAFAALPAQDVAFLTSADGKAALVQLLSYHVVNGVIPSYNLFNGSTTTVPSVQGTGLTVAKSADGQVVTVNGIATVTTPDVLASNGIVHVIDTVLSLARR